MKLPEYLNNEMFKVLSTHEKIVILILRMRCEEENLTCYPSITRIAADCSMSRVTVIKALKKLKMLGFVEVKRKPKNKGNLYKVKI